MTARRLCSEEHYPRPLLAIAGHGLPGAGSSFPQAPLDDDAWLELLRAAHANRVIGLLVAAMDGGVLPVTEKQSEQARTTYRANAIRALALERELIAVTDLLTSREVETRVLKGSAVARLDYANGALRSFIDLDILVRPADIDRAVQVLSDAGFARTLAEPRPGFDRRFDKGMTLIAPAGYELDLHRTFVLGPWGVRVDIDTLWDAGEEFAIGGRQLVALSHQNRLMHACYHAALGNWPLRLASLRDVAEMVCGPRLDADALIRLASRWGVEAVVAAAVADSGRLLGGTGFPAELASWAQRYVPSRREAAHLALHTRADKTFAAQALATLRVLPGLSEKAAYVRALMFPDLRYTAGRHSSALSRFRYAVREVWRGRPARRSDGEGLIE